jgi:hypothetical protein
MVAIVLDISISEVFCMKYEKDSFSTPENIKRNIIRSRQELLMAKEAHMENVENAILAVLVGQQAETVEGIQLSAELQKKVSDVAKDNDVKVQDAIEALIEKGLSVLKEGAELDI